MPVILLSIMYYIITAFIFYFVVFVLQYVRFLLGNFSNQDRIKLVFLFLQIVSLSISLSIFFNSPYLLERQNLKVNTSIKFSIIASVIFYLLSAFGFQNESPKAMRKVTVKRVIASVIIAFLFFVLFTMSMDYIPDFNKAIHEINPSDAAGFIAFAILTVSLLIYAISGLKPNGKYSGLTITLSVAMAIVHIIIVYYIYIQKIPQSKWDYYFNKLGGYN